ncbi:MAG: flippase, partial [Candidatus Woesearchaeota archaeon]|nr:flippase [Candidatus Woesearchaeota archaeon]
MNTIKRIAKNTAISSVSEIVTKLIYFVITLYIARQLGTESLGQYSFAFAFSMIMLIVADIGLSQLLIREIARKKFLANKYVTHAFLIKLLTSSITIILTIGILNILNYPAITRSITYAMVAFIILRSFSEILFSVFRAHERMEFDSSIRILRMVLILPFFIYHLNTSLAKAVLAFPIVEIFILIISLTIGVTKFFKFRLELDIEFIKSIFQKAFPMGAAIIFSSLYFYLGSIILSKFQGDAALGIYSAAYNFSLALLFIPAMFTTAIYPLLSRYYKESDEKLHKLFKYSFKYLYIIALPIAVGALLLGNEIMTLFYGPGFLQAGLALKILSLFLLIKFINFLLGIVLYSVDKQKQRMYAQASTAIFNIILNLILI